MGERRGGRGAGATEAGGEGCAGTRDPIPFGSDVACAERGNNILDTENAKSSPARPVHPLAWGRLDASPGGADNEAGGASMDHKPGPERSKQRGGAREPMISRADVDAALGPDAAALGPAERFEALVKRVLHAEPAKPADGGDSKSGASKAS